VAAAVVLIVLRLQREETPQVATTPPPKPAPALAHQEAPVPAPAPPQHGTCNLTPADGDVTASIAAEPAHVTECYAQTTRELIELANEARGEWPEDRKHEFDNQLAALQKRVASVSDERPRQDAYRKLIRYLQRAVVRDDVALANIGGAP
jgi:hypothetical protein